MNHIPPDDQEAFEFQVTREKWYEEQDRQYIAEEAEVLRTMTCEDTLEAVEHASKSLHEEMWAAMKNEDIYWMKEVLMDMYKDYASMKAHQNVDARIR